VVRSADHYAQKEALFSVGQVCHPKALGEANVTAVDWEAWQGQIEKLHDACALAFNALEKGSA
jgi:pyridoxine/pyridoxamine 5'-phosphate oxidase